MRALLLTLVALVVAVGVLRLAVIAVEPSMAFFPLKGRQATPADLGIAFEDVRLTTSDGESIHAWLLPSERPRAAVLYWHGNGGNLSLWLPVYADLSRRGLTVFAIDYRGYGESSGNPTEEGLYRDADASIAEFWRRLPEPPVPVVYWGRSLGSTVAAYATTVRSPDGLVLETPFPDKDSLLAHYPVMRALAVFSRYRFPTAEFLRGFDRPSLVVHGTRDSTVPIEEGRKVYAGLREPREFAEIPGADHNDLRAVNADLYWRAIDGFIDRLSSPIRP